MAEFSLGQAMLGTAVDLGGLSAGLDKAKTQTRSWVTGLQKSIGGGLLAGLGMVTAAITGIGAAAWSVGIDFDEAGDVLIAATGASGQALDDMSDSVVRLHGTVAGLDRSMSDIALVMGEVSTRTGATGPALDEFTGQVLKMTAITGGDGVEAVEKITRVMGDWSVPLEDSSLLMDKLFGAGQTWGIGLESLAGKLVQFGAPLRQMGFGLDESIAMLGKWEKEGVNTELVIGSLRIAAGKFASEQAEGNQSVVGGVKSLVEAQAQMDDLRQKLQIAQVQQSEFTDKTKESARLAKQNQIDEITQQIEALESAMALGEFRTISSTSANKSLAESLKETFDAIKNASDGTEALNIGMEVFGARAGPDMTAAIREGRFELDDAVAAMGGMAGSIDDVTERSLGLGERWEIAMTRVKDSLLPVGEGLMGLGLQAMPFVEEAAGKMAEFISTTLPGVIGDVRTAWDEDWGGIRTTVEATVLALQIEYIKLKFQAALLVQELEEKFEEADIVIDWTGLKIPVSEKTQFVLTWSELWAEATGFASRGMINIGTQVVLGLQYVRGLWQYGSSLITGDWAGAWEGWKLGAKAGLDSILSMIGVWSPELAEGMRAAVAMLTEILRLEWELYSGWFKEYVADPVLKFFNDLRNSEIEFYLPEMGGGGGVPGYAVGTASAPGGLALVGEEGPELVNLPRGSQVFTARETREMLGDGGSGGTGERRGAAERQSGGAGEWESSVFGELVRSEWGRDVLRSSVNKESQVSRFFEVISALPAFALGTAAAPGGLALVGEMGPELVHLPGQGGPDGRTGGGGAVTINNYTTVNNEMDIAVLTERILGQLRRQQEMQAWQPTF